MRHQRLRRCLTIMDEHPRDEPTNSGEEPESSRKVFSNIALIGPVLFYEGAFSKDELAARFARATPDTSRDFVVLRTLAEVQTYGVVARRWDVAEKTHKPG